MKTIYYHRLDVPFKYGEYSHAMLSLSDINNDTIECDESKVSCIHNNQFHIPLRIRFLKHYEIVWR